MIEGRRDRAAAEILVSSRSDVHEVRRLAGTCAELGFTRVAVRADVTEPAMATSLCRALESVPRCLVVLDSGEALGTSGRRGRVMVRQRDPDADAVRRARDLGARSLVPARAGNLAGLEAVLTSPDAAEWVVADFSGEPGDLRAIGSLPVARLQVWDDVLGRRLAHQHPCYTYLCAASACHLGRVPRPRRVTITHELDVVPYGLPAHFSLGALGGRHDLRRVLEEAHSSLGWRRFTSLAREAFHTHLTASGSTIISVDAALHAASRALPC